MDGENLGAKMEIIQRLWDIMGVKVFFPNEETNLSEELTQSTMRDIEEFEFVGEDGNDMFGTEGVNKKIDELCKKIEGNVNEIIQLVRAEEPREIGLTHIIHGTGKI